MGSHTRKSKNTSYARFCVWLEASCTRVHDVWFLTRDSHDSSKSFRLDEKRGGKVYTCREVLCVVFLPCLLVCLLGISLCSLIIYYHLEQVGSFKDTIQHTQLMCIYTGCVSKNLTLYENVHQTKPTFGKWSALLILQWQVSLDQNKVKSR